MQHLGVVGKRNGRRRRRGGGEEGGSYQREERKTLEWKFIVVSLARFVTAVVGNWDWINHERNRVS